MMSWMLAAMLMPTAQACDAVVGATVHTPEGPQAGWTVVWDGGRITAVGPAANVDGCTVQEANGGHVTAGFIAASTHMGIVEVELEAGTRDDKWDGDAVRAAHQPVQAYNPRSAVVGVTRQGGITTAVVHPSGGLVAGQIGAVSLAPGAQADTVLLTTVAISVDPGALGSRAAGLTRMRELLDDARQYGQGKAYTSLSDLSASRLDLEALQGVVAGQVPLLVGLDRASDIEAWLAFAGTQGVRLIVDGGAEAWRVADQLASADVPVILDPLVYGAGSFSQLAGRPDNGALLVEAGVTVVLTLRETHNARALRYSAGNAVRGGMTHPDALRAITAAPAAVFGLQDRGVIEVGAIADLAVWTDDPLDVPARLARLIIGGEAVSTTTRQDALVEAWRTVPRVWWPDADAVAPKP